MATEQTKNVETKEISVEERLRALNNLQKVVSKIDKIRTLRGELPLEVQDLEDEVAGLETRINNYQSEVEEHNAEISKAKLKKKEAKQQIAVKEEAKNNVRNNREFDSLTKEIEYCGLEIVLSEKKISELNKNIEINTAEIDAIQAKLAERKYDLEQKRAELDEIISETRQEEEQLQIQSKELKTLIESRLLSAFERIRSNARNGLALVAVERNACGGCFNKIPPQRQMDIRTRKKIIVCEYCGRILVDSELNSEDITSTED